MGYGFLDTLKTPGIEAARKANGGDAAWANFVGHRDFDRFTDDERAFIDQRDSSTWQPMELKDSRTIRTWRRN